MSDTSNSKVREAGRTAKLVVGAVLLVLLTIFAVSNTDQTDIDFLVGDPVRLPLILVLIVTAVLGAVIYELFRFTRARR